MRKGKLRRRGIAADEVATQVARDHEACARFGAVGAAPFVGGVGSLDEPAAALLLDRPAFEGVPASAIVVHGSILLGEHERKDTSRLCRVGGIVRTEFEGGIVVIDFPEELIVPELEASEVVLAMRIVVGSFDLAGDKLFSKIDYYDSTLEFGSDDPADPSKTTRVLTLMLAVEY